MKVLLVATTLIALVNADSVFPKEKEFQDWKAKFGKIYKSVADESQHKNTWMENFKLVLEHNKKADQGNKSYRLGMNYFADMSNQEYKESLLKGCLLSFNRTKNDSEATFLRQTGADLPKTLNWTDKGYVTDITDQKDCHSCWAFSATGALEGQIFKKTGKLVSLSKQQLVDCSQKYGNKGCKGGCMEFAFEYVKENEGLNTEDSYPYEAKDGSCRYNPATVGAICTGYVDIMSDDEEALKEAVATIGPVSVAIDAGHISFRFYESGVYDEPECSSTDLSHGVLAVGYGTDDGKDYWLVKNSWGLNWGESGYIRMSRNKNNQCGIATAASYPLVSNKTQHVQCEACVTIFVLGYFLLGMFY